MSRRKSAGPSVEFIKLKRDLDSARRELSTLKKSLGVEGATPAAPAAPATPAGLEVRVAELEETRERLSRLYFNQLEENRRRAQKLQHILGVVSELNSSLDPDTLLNRIAETIQQSLGFRIVLIRLREPGGDVLRARAFAGLSQEAREYLEGEDVHVADFLSWLKDDFKVSHSYYISHKEPFSRILPRGFVADLGHRKEWEWHEDDVLLVPLYNRQGELTAYFSVDDPVDRMVPSQETIEQLEIFGNHSVGAIENARLYRKLEARARDLEEATRRTSEVNALKNNFVATISHELRTPLTAIRAYVETLLGMPTEALSGDQVVRFLSVIDEESQRLARLIESVLDLNRFDSGRHRLERRAVDMAEVVDDSIKMLEPVARAAQVALKLDIRAADTRVDADRDQLRQLVLHLGNNAIKFTPAGGTTTVGLTGDQQEITLRVEDTGIGIPEEALELIFERFYQVDSSLVRRYGGSGLGLAICKSVVDWHGGRIFANSAPGKGSCFTVVLPRRTAPRVVVRQSPRLRPATEDVLKLAVEMVAEVMDARFVSVMACEPNGELVVQAAVGMDERVVQEARSVSGRGVSGWVAEQRRPVCVSPVAGFPGVAGSGREKYRSKTYLAVPIEGPNGLLGVLNVTDPISQKTFGAEDCHMLLDLADRIAIAWHQAQSLEESHSQVEGATTALRQLLQHITRGRRNAPNRVRLSRAIARELQLTEAEVGVIGFAATVHDVGMTLVGQDALDRGGVLTTEERNRMERHAELGVELLKPIEAVGAVREVVLSHHEWYDGSGYPRQLAGMNIPIGARVLAVVDAYESMTAGRAHRPAVTSEEALLEIGELKGRQFDPEVVEALERALPALEVQRAEFTEVGATTTFQTGR